MGLIIRTVYANTNVAVPVDVPSSIAKACAATSLNYPRENPRLRVITEQFFEPFLREFLRHGSLL